MRRDQRGQILPLFALFLVALFALAALLFDAAQALTLRRQLQDAGDAAALAGANVTQAGSPRGCSSSAGPPPGSPRAGVSAAAVDAITQNLSWYPSGDVVVTCPSGWNNGAVRVQLTRTSPSFFRSIVGGGAFTVNTTSTAVHGYGNGNGYSVIVLDPYNSTWPVNLDGCPALLFAGSPNVTFYGSVQVNSACPSGSGGALTQSGSASTVTMAAGRYIDVVGGVRVNGLTVLPAIRTGRPVLPDPLANLPAVNVGALTVRSATRITVQNSTRVFDPGVYQGGIEIRNNGIGIFRPGIYVLEPTTSGTGGGLSSVATGQIYTVSAGLSTSSQGSWPTDCPAATCGVLFYNRARGAVMGQIDVQAGAAMLVRGYNPEADTGAAALNDYRGLLWWQDRNPVPTISTIQPQIRLNGGSTVYMVGTVYGPSAPVRLGGTSGGGGSYNLDYPLQFIVWDLEFQGTAAWVFQYNDQLFYRPVDYGLIE